MERQKEVFYTSSLNVIAYLKMKGIDYESVTEFNGKKLFLYIKTDSLQEKLDEYRGDKFINGFLKELKNLKEFISK